MSVWLRVAGYPATEIGAHTPPTFETWADGGSGSASWAFSLSVRSQHQALRPGALVEIICGSLPLWSGLMSEPDRTTWECTAYGMASAGQKFPALDGSGNVTRDLATAIDTARGMGWQVTNPFGVAGTVSGDGDSSPISVAQLLTQYAEQTGMRWGVDGQRRLFMRADPTTPTWLASPGSAAFGTTDEDVNTRLIGRYLDATSSSYASADVGSGFPVGTEDLTDRGPMSLAEANAILAGMLVRRGDRAWTNGATLTRGQIQTMGGTPAFRLAVQAGQMVRTLGISHAPSALALDTVIGKTRYTPGEDSIYIEPVNTAPRTFSGVIAAT